MQRTNEHFEETVKMIRGESPAVCDICGYTATPAQLRHMVVSMCADGVKRCKVCADKAFDRYHPNLDERIAAKVEREQERIKKGLPV